MENELKVFLASYLFDDGDWNPEWSLEIYAKDFEEAQRKVKAIKESLKLDGELQKTIKVEGEPE